jgi:ubiquinone/menaquinone biosynthesis C-methylase UbiE
VTVRREAGEAAVVAACRRSMFSELRLSGAAGSRHTLAQEQDLMAAYDHDSPRLAAIYDKISDSQFEGGMRLAERLEIKAGDRVLDVGCGTGRLTSWLAERVGPAGAVVGIDPLPERIALARSRNAELRFAVGGAEDLSAFPDQGFDAVCLNAVFHWIGDKPRALAEIHRVLRPGGRVGITTSPKDLYWMASMPALCASVFATSPYLEALEPSALEVMNRHLTTSELLGLLNEQHFVLTELHVVRRAQRFESGDDVVDFADASSFGNFLQLVPERLRAALRADLVAAFDARNGAEGIQLRSFGGLLVAERETNAS